jgi:hypothetical protein
MASKGAASGHARGARRKRRLDLDGVDVRAEPRGYGRLVARARTELVHSVGGLEMEGIGHGCHDEGLRDRLPLADRQRAIGIRFALHGRRNETVARDRAQRLEKARIGDASRRDLLLDHRPALRAPILLRLGVETEHRQAKHAGR